jgi:hypothetical protein
VQSTVKWFSREKGYGFIVGASASDISMFGALREHPFRKRAPALNSQPQAQGTKATDVKLLSQAVGHNDERIPCLRKKIVPRIITDRGVLRRSVCPFCGRTVKLPFLVALRVFVAALPISWFRADLLSASRFSQM